MPKVKGGTTTSEFNRRLGLHIRAARDAAHLTQKALGDKLGVTVQTVSDWENGRHPPSCENLRNITDACSVSSSFLLSERLHKREGGLEALGEHLAAVLGSRRAEDLLEMPPGRLKREVDILTGRFRSGESASR